ncbi:MAG: adenosine deaminase [Gammaproteobacteria bacterium]|nr:adenosine deaminase [Gammaproteobacteria bacterium]
MTSIDDLISALPKAELHIHLEGSLEPEMVFVLADRNGIPLDYASVDVLQDAYSFSGLQDFLDIYYTGMRVLQTERDFYDLATAYFERAMQDNVRHAEVFFDPQAHTDRGVPLAEVVGGIVAAVKEAALAGLGVYLIPCFLRHLSGQDAMDSLVELEPFVEHFCGVGLDSSELGHPPSKFVAAFERARELGLKLVAHAGEEGPPEYVWEALDILHVDRIDHGNRALEDSALVERLRNHQVPLTVCPLSNLKLAVVDDLRFHPLKSMLDAGLVTTVNSDDPAYFGGYLNKNFREIANSLDLSVDEVITLAENSFTASFLPESEIQKHLEEIGRIRVNLSVSTSDL